MEKQIKDLYQKFREENVEMIDRWLYFAYKEIPSKVELSMKDRCLSILAVLLGSQGQEEFERIVKYALDQGVEAEAIQEVVYQATAYLGMGRVAPFLQSWTVFFWIEMFKCDKIGKPQIFKIV
ncbi:carboxymuconolactone decarboxylase family protein [Dubosiella newyorkensis]|uniref:carboxymuconolactone decarboxylase family protein n=1 Tax=Dubosiella newyorkensis TaxID=1862672 RepID=UPI0023F58690|nr:carboxymuconolactone decarboxylase family protein [Dubosiella newyorkensis]